MDSCFSYYRLSQLRGCARAARAHRMTRKPKLPVTVRVGRHAIVPPPVSVEAQQADRLVRERAYGFALAMYVAEGNRSSERLMIALTETLRALYGDVIMVWAVDEVRRVARAVSE